MTADREVLREAVLKALTGGYGYAKGYGTAEDAADAIVDAVLAAQDQHTTIDWGVRCTEPGHRNHGPSPIYFMSRAAAQRFADNKVLGGHELVCRRRYLGDWEPVTE